MFKREKLLVLFIATFFVIGFGSTRVGAQQSIAIQSLESDKYRSICQPQPYSEITSNTNAVAAIGSAVGSPAPATLAIVGTLSSSLHPEQHLLSNIGVNFEKDRWWKFVRSVQPSYHSPSTLFRQRCCHGHRYQSGPDTTERLRDLPSC